MKKAEAGLSKAELVKKAGELGFFKKKGIKSIWGRGNGSFYYTKPPMFIDGHESYEITREDVEGKGSGVEYPMNVKNTAKAVKDCTSQEELDALVADGKLLKDDERAGVIKALEAKNAELSA